MNQELNQRIVELVEKSKNILLLMPRDYDGDALSSCLAFYNYLTESIKDKTVDLILPQKPKKIYSFLPKIEEIRVGGNLRQRLVLSLDTKVNKISKIDYFNGEDTLDLFISSHPNPIDSENIKVAYDSHYDLVITFGVTNLASLGDFYKNKESFFRQTPIINIDNNSRNELFGFVNFVDKSKKSLSEIVFDFFAENHVFITKDIANCIMSGLVFSTRGFSNHNVTSNALEIASKLMDLGANREKIIENIYQTKSISLLRAWGNILSELNYDESHKVAWSELQTTENEHDDEIEIKDLIDELISKAYQAEVIVLFQIIQIDLLKIYIHSSDRHNSLKLIDGIIDALDIKGDEDLVSFQITGLLQDIKHRILDIVRKNTKSNI